LNASSNVVVEKGVLGVQEVTRPSDVVVDVNARGWEGERSVRVTGMECAGLPMEVSRMWQVIGGFFSVDMLGRESGGLGEVVRCCDRAVMRWVAVVEGGMRVCSS
jgi:hypothetical protein